MRIVRQALRSITTAAALGLGTLKLCPADWWPWVRGTYVVAPGMLAGGVAGVLLLVNSPPDEQPDPGDGSLIGHPKLQRVRSLPPPARMVIAAGFGTTVSAMHAGSLRADAAVESWLSRRGVTHPRRWMAGTATAMSLVGDLVETHHGTPEPEREHT